jgi:hypothetical protein
MKVGDLLVELDYHTGSACGYNHNGYLGFKIVQRTEKKHRGKIEIRTLP